MATPTEAAPARAAETPDALPRTEADVEGRLEELRTWVKGHPHPMNHIFWLDLEEFEAQVEEIIAILPKEVRSARRITRDEGRILEAAKDEARRLLEEARAEAEQIVARSRDEAERLVEGSVIRQRALEQAEATLARAEETAAEIRHSSYSYAQQVIDNVVSSLKRLAQSVEQDRAQLEQMEPGSETEAKQIGDRR
jgi:cell division septum initiation protein DivIVA